MASTSGPGAGLEKIPANEPAQIDNVAALTVQQLERRYGAAPRFLRGVHPKDHGCVEAAFMVYDNLDPQYQVGVFRKPGQRFRAAIRFSNASTLVTPDTPLEPGPGGAQVRAHGSRGMAIKLYDVEGPRLVNGDRERTQDFLMINQPVFAFANVEDYEVISALIAKDDALAAQFFARLQSPDEAVRKRAATSRAIIGRIKGFAPPPFQPAPLSPLDNRYFSAAPFAFGEGRVMKFSATPVNPVAGELGDAVNDPDYLRNAMRKRMAEAEGLDICFDFQVQVRSAESLNIETDIEDVCTLWDEAKYPFVTVARISISQQDISSPERQEFCETLFYTPWHGLSDHRPLGGINRLRQKVYEKSSERRGCPVSPELPRRAKWGEEPAPQAPPGQGGSPRGGGQGRRR